MKTMPLVMLLIASLLFAASVEAQRKPANAGPQQKVYRWVDENGEVHFSETLPPDMQDKKHDVLDGRGIIRETDLTLVPPPPPPPVKDKTKKGELPRDKSGMARPEPLYNPQELRVQQDALLLLRYDSDLEIVDAMNVEIDGLAYDKRLLETSRASLEEAYKGNLREAAERQRAGLPVEPKLAKDIQNFKSHLARNTGSLAKLKDREDSIRQTFETELEHYRTLVAQNAEKKD